MSVVFFIVRMFYSSTTPHIVIQTLLLMVIFRFSTLASIIDVSKEIVQFKYQCYLKCLEHDENSLNYDKQYEYFYHI